MPHDENRTPLPGTRVGPGDQRFAAVIAKQFNKRFTATLGYVRKVNSTEEVIAAVDEASREGRRLAVTSVGTASRDV